MSILELGIIKQCFDIKKDVNSQIEKNKLNMKKNTNLEKNKLNTKKNTTDELNDIDD
jgi:hypothetical protein